MTLAAALCRRAGVADPRVLSCLTRLSEARTAAHTCLAVEPEEAEALRATPLVRGPADAKRTPLVLDGDLLYLDRLWTWQERLVAGLRARVGPPLPFDGAGLERFEDPGQRLAAATVARQRLAVITGGPGTGKTSIVKGILPLLDARRVLLLAPTGKAAARLSEAVGRPASTIHRALGARPGQAVWRHHAGNPVPADLVVVDEASMIDLPTMARLVDAVRPDARLVLLGDPDQLASVEVGAVLGDLRGAAVPGRPPDRGAAVPGRPSLGDSFVRLTRTYRYGEDSGIRALAEAINAGDVAAALAAFGRPDLERLPDLRDRAVERYSSNADFRVLAAHRRGRRGVERLNRDLEAWLAEAGHVDCGDEFYDGRPVMVLQNDPQTRLFNGDVGVCRAGRVWFDDGRSVHPAALPEHETVYAMTVHKAQGSEFDEVVVVLPDEPSPLLTRELLYTAVTRARKRVALVGSEDVLAAAIATPVERTSGLRRALAAVTG